MPFYYDALDSLRRNAGLVFLYSGFAFCWGLLDELVERSLFPELGPEVQMLPPEWRLYHLASLVLSCAASAAITAIVFARMGREIDRPLWKCSGTPDALRRFFTLWFILYLGTQMLRQLGLNRLAYGDEFTGNLLLFGFMLSFVCTIPVGACVMYSGALHWDRLYQALRPLMVMYPISMYVFSVAFFEFVLLVGVILFSQPFADMLLYLPLVNVVLSAFECLIFVLTWRICMLHREFPPESSLDDLDF